MKNIKYMSNDEIELTCAQMLDQYMDRIGAKSKILPSIDIDDFVMNYLGCTVVYECIAARSNCLGFASDGITKLAVSRNGRRREVLYDRDVIVLDKYLQTHGNESKRRFVLGHEAGHIITNRIYGNTAAYYNHAFDNEASYNQQLLLGELNIYETQADRFSACLLMPKPIVLKYLETYLNSNKVIRYENYGISKYDQSMLLRIANEMKVSITAFMIRLKELNLIEVKPLSFLAESKEVFPYEPI